jgi:hypothetical protein
MRLIGLEGVIRAILNLGSIVARGSRPRVHAPAREQRGGGDQRQEAGRPYEFPDSAHLTR